MKIHQEKPTVKCECPEGGKRFSLVTYKFYHKCKGKREDLARLPQTEIIKFNTDTRVGRMKFF